jgi:type IV pilus assembly protein PilF
MGPNQLPIDRPSSEQPSNLPGRAGAKLHTELGTAYMQAARLGVALDEANIAIAFDSTYPAAHLLKALVYAELDQMAAARPAFETASRLAPGAPDVNNAYGWFLCSQGQIDEGLMRLEQAARNPYFASPARAWTNAALCMLLKKDDVGAEERFLRATALDDHLVMPLFYLADISLRNGRFLRAKQWIDQLMNTKPDVGVDVLWLALRIERKLDNDAAVKKYAEKMRSDFPGSIEYQNYLQGKFE